MGNVGRINKQITFRKNWQVQVVNLGDRVPWCLYVYLKCDVVNVLYICLNYNVFVFGFCNYLCECILFITMCDDLIATCTCFVCIICMFK